MQHLDFHFAGSAIRVEGPRPILVWLQEFLTPQFPVISGPEPDRTIRFSADARDHAQLHAQGPHPQAGRVACFTLDTGILSATRWTAPDGGLAAFDEGADLFYRRPPSEPGVIEMVAARDTGPARVALMRMVREFAMMYAARAGWLLVHGAAVRVGEGAVVIAGPKRAGKTTLLLYALRHERGAYISNDRVAIRLEGAQAFVHGIPTIVSLREGSAAWFPTLEAELATGQYDCRRLLAECQAATPRAPLGRPAKWSLSPRQLCHLLAAESRATERLSAVLFSTVMEEEGATALEELPSDRALEALRATLFRPLPPEGMCRIDGRPDAGEQERARLLTARLASRLPSFSCRLGTDAYAEGSGWLGRLARRHAPLACP